MIRMNAAKESLLYTLPTVPCHLETWWWCKDEHLIGNYFIRKLTVPPSLTAFLRWPLVSSHNAETLKDICWNFAGSCILHHMEMTRNLSRQFLISTLPHPRENYTTHLHYNLLSARGVVSHMVFTKSLMAFWLWTDDMC